MQRAALLIFVLLVTVSCEKEEIEMSSLAGRWEWIRTDGGFAFHIHETPGSTGESIELELKKGNRFYVYANGALTSQGTYVINTKKCIHDHQYKQVIDFSSGADMMIESIGKDSLHLSDDMYDGIAVQYKRKGNSSQL